MLSQSKGVIGVGIVVEAILGILVLALAVGMIATGGTFFNSIAEGLGLVDKQVGSQITVKDKETLSDAAKYAYDRASNDGCKKGGAVDQQNAQEGYPGLKDTYLGQKPPCAGLEGGPTFEDKNLAGYDTGNDMEGVFSRVEFKISEDREGPIILTQNGKWLEDNLIAASDEGFYQRISNKCDPNAVKSFTNKVGSFMYGFINPAKVIEADYIGTGSKFIVYFENPEDVNKRASFRLEDRLQDTVYCSGWGQSVAFTSFEIGDSPVIRAVEDTGELEVRLCPGDEGYIQVNKGDPNNDGEAGEEFTGDTEKFAYIQIKRVKQESCGDVESKVPYNGLQSGERIKIASDAPSPGQEGNGESYPNVKTFKLLKNANTAEDGIAYTGSGKCQIEITELDHTSPSSPTGFASYKVGTKIDAKDGDFSKNSIGPSRKLADSIFTEITEYYDLFDKLKLDGEKITPHDKVGSLRVSHKGGFGYNELYGDLLCANPDNSGNAEWHICSEEMEGRTVGKWICTDKNWHKMVKGVVTNEISEEGTWGNQDVVQEESSSFMFYPGNSPQNDRLTWGPIPPGNKQINIVLEFKERGHLEIGAQEDDTFISTTTLSSVYTGPDGESDVYYSSTSDRSIDAGFDYAVGKEYTIQIDRREEKGRTLWRFMNETKDGSKDVQLFNTFESPDFRQIALKSGRDAEKDPIVEIKKVEIIDE